MSKTLDFKKVRKQYMTVTLADEKNTTILIGMPTKAVMNDLITLQESLEEITEENSEAATEELYAVCARVMSRNKGGIKITTEMLSEIFDFEDIMIFFNAYMEFISEVVNSKN